MQLRWTEEAANDLERVVEYLVQNTLAARKRSSSAFMTLQVRSSHFRTAAALEK
jgi:plasmid stabilization system protein ParE